MDFEHKWGNKDSIYVCLASTAHDYILISRSNLHGLRIGGSVVNASTGRHPIIKKIPDESRGFSVQSFAGSNGFLSCFFILIFLCCAYLSVLVLNYAYVNPLRQYRWERKS